MGRPKTPWSVRLRFWLGLRSGLTVKDAAAGVGVSRASGFRWIGEAGGVIPRATRNSREPGSGRLSFEERLEIAHRHSELRQSARAIGAALARSPSTISRELARGRTASGYRATVAEHSADQRSRRPKTRKLARLPLRRKVLKMLRQRLSPEQVAGRLRLEHPDEPEMWVSHETIYQYIYVQARGGLRAELTAALRTGRARRRTQGRQSHGSQLKDMVMISDRPPEIEDRAVPGHWEGDLILGSTASGSAIGTLVERCTGFVLLLHLPGDHTSRTVADAMIAKMKDLPEQLRRSLTWDQGREMALHREITLATGLNIYFCDPHSPWQRGTNENTNGLLRQYFPKGTDLSAHGPGILDNIAAELNARPRKRHSWHTPAEMLQRLLSKQPSPNGDAKTA